MSEFRLPQNDNSALDVLFKLQALKQNRDNLEVEARRDALRTVLQVQQAGGDPSALLERLNDPALSSSLQSATEAQKSLRAAEAFAGGTRPDVVAPFLGALTPVADQSGRVVPPAPEEAQRTRDNFVKVLRMRGVTDEAQIQSALGILDAGTSAGARGAQERIAEERRRFAQQDALSSRAAGRAEAASRRAEARQLAAEQRAATTRDAEEFTLNASQIAFADPSRKPELIKQAADRFGDAEARRLEFRMANMTESGMAKVKLDKKAYQAKVAATLEQGKTQDPRIASLAAEGKAGYDPNTGFYYIGQDAATEQRMASLASLYEIRDQYEKAAELFAQNSGGATLTGTIEDLKGKIGTNDPYFNALQLLQTKYETDLGYYKSGANVSEGEKQAAELANPKFAALNIKDNQLQASARVQFAGQREELESLYLARFGRNDRPAVRNALRENAKQRIEEVGQDKLGWIKQLGAPTTRGAAVFQSIQDAAQSSQPGSR